MRLKCKSTCFFASLISLACHNANADITNSEIHKEDNSDDVMVVTARSKLNKLWEFRLLVKKI